MGEEIPLDDLSDEEMGEVGSSFAEDKWREQQSLIEDLKNENILRDHNCMWVHACFLTVATVVAATLHVFRLACMHSGKPSPAWLCTLTLQTISAEKAAALLSHTGQGVSPFNYITDD